MYKYGKEWQHNLREKKQAYRLLNDKSTENMINGQKEGISKF
jgi:hypothetical protein